MANGNVVWRRRNEFGKSVHVTEVSVVNGNVGINGFSIGPRGGGLTYGAVGFSPVEWSEITAAVAQAQAEGR